jgi:putative redox protein
MTMTATARPINGTLRHEINVNARHTITTDEPEQLGGNDTAPTPHELLPAMLAACVSTMITLYARTRDWQLQDLQVDVNYNHDTTPRQVHTTIHLPDGLTPDQIQRLQQVAETCPVKRALETGFTFKHQIAPTPTTARKAS